jgi:DNA replication initiation complex subunit (GINS family)
MYDELFEIWKHETENTALGKLAPDFYSKVASYIRKIKEEGRMLDKKTVKARLLTEARHNVEQLVREIISMRYNKILIKKVQEENTSLNGLATEEEKISGRILPVSDAFRLLTKTVLSGTIPIVDIEYNHNLVVVHVLREIPEIIGVDLKAYGPFQAGDIASLPRANANSLIKQHIVEIVGIK